MGKDVCWDGKTGTVYIGGEVEKPLREVYLYKKPYIDSNNPSITPRGKDGEKYLEFKSIGWSKTAYIEYPLNGLANTLFAEIGDIQSNHPEAYGEYTYRIFDENGSLLYESLKMQPKHEWQKVELDVRNVLKIRLEIQSYGGTGVASPSFRNLRVLTTDY